MTSECKTSYPCEANALDKCGDCVVCVQSFFSHDFVDFLNLFLLYIYFLDVLLNERSEN